MALNFATDVTVNGSNILQAKILKAPSTSGGTTYTTGTSGQVLKSNGSSVYWTDDEKGILEYNDYSDFPLSGTEGLLYIDKTTNEVYRWGGAAYIMIQVSPTSITNAEIDALFE